MFRKIVNYCIEFLVYYGYNKWEVCGWMWKKDVKKSEMFLFIEMKIIIIIVDDNLFIWEGMKIILNIYEEFNVVVILKDG